MKHLRYGLSAVGIGMVSILFFSPVIVGGAAPVVLFTWWTDGAWWGIGTGIVLSLVVTAALSSWLADRLEE